MKKVYSRYKNGHPIGKYHYELEEGDEQYIIDHYGVLSNRVIANHFGIPVSSAYNIIKSIIHGPEKNSYVWNSRKQGLLIKLYPTNDNVYCAEKLGIPVRDVSRRANQLGLVKTVDLKAKNEEIDNILRQIKQKTSSLKPCPGRFCIKKTECRHYDEYINQGKPTFGLLNDGSTTRCIGIENFTFFLSNDNE